jgi:hypothetical protein
MMTEIRETKKEDLINTQSYMLEEDMSDILAESNNKDLINLKIHDNFSKNRNEDGSQLLNFNKNEDLNAQKFGNTEEISLHSLRNT